MLKTFSVTLDIEKELYNPAIMSFSISQADLSVVELTINIRQDDDNFDLTNSTNVQLGIKKPSGLVVYQDCEVTDPAAGIIKATLSNQAYIEWGIYTAEVYIKDYNVTADQDLIAVTCPFFYYSRSAVMSDEALESFNDWTALQDLLLTYDKKPVLVEGIPTIDPEYIGQIAFDTVGRRAFIAGGLTVDLWQSIGGSGEGGGGGIVSWADIIGKPTSFPPSFHSHNWDDITNKPTTFFPISHTHLWTDITDKPQTFTPSAHLHSISDINGLQTTLDGKADDADLIPFITEAEADGKYALKGETGGVTSFTWDDITGKPTTFPPSVHTHDFTTGITGKPTSYPSTWTDVSGKPTTFAPVAHTHTWTEVTGKPTAFVPTAHTHAIADVIGLQTELDSKIEAIPPEYLTDAEGDLRYAFKGDTGGGGGSVPVEDTLTSTSTTSALSANQGRILNNSKSPIGHTHLWADITDKPTTFPTDPVTWDDVTDKPTTFPSDPVDWAEVTGKPTVFTPATHTHLWNDITDKPATFPTDPIAWDDVTGKPATFPSDPDDWTDITGKPTTFPPSTHTHTWTEVTGKPTTFTPTAHTHLWADLTDKPTEFKPNLMSGGVRGGAMVGNGLGMSNEYLLVKTLTSGGTKIDVPNNAVVIDRSAVDLWYAPKTHTHLWADLTDKPTTFAPAAHNQDWTTITGKPTTYPATAHTHLWVDITDKPTTFTPTAHTHTWTEVTGKPTTFTPAAHTHLIEDLPAELLTDSEAAALYQPKGTYLTALPTHTHLWADITDKPTEFKPQIMTGAQRGGAMVGNGLKMTGEYLLVNTLTTGGIKIDTVNNAVVIDRAVTDPWYALKTHTHAISEVTGLQNALDGKVDDSQMNGLTLWKGTQAAYDALTPDSNTLYFISG